MSGLRAGIVGFGLAGEVFHAPLIDAVDGIDVACVVTTDPERQARVRAAYPNANVVPDVEQLWDAVDVLVIATPNRAHVPLGLAAVERGMPVVVDKPLAPSADDGERLVEAAEAAGAKLTVFQNRRLDGDFLTLRALLERGELGTVTRFESRFERFRPQVGDGWRELG
ncbi:MAG TPA: Gfo/Idh/MocA family oxidoreductase, partial [Thermoleophilaceae bacterium]